MNSSSCWYRLYMFHFLMKNEELNERNIDKSIHGNLFCYIGSPVQLYRTKSICTRPKCPKREHITTATDIGLERLQNQLAS
jgi:hypothetical protein